MRIPLLDFVRVAWCLCAVVAGCDNCPDAPDDCVEDRVTLTHGIYGQLFQGDDVIRDDDCEEYPRPVSYPIWLETADGMRVAEDIADDRGAFELVAPAGEYKPCVLKRNTAWCGGTVTVPAIGRTRYDVVTGVFSTFARKRGPALCGKEP